MQVTVITPIAPHHEKQFVRCADSVRKQTVECRHLHMVDTEMRGPAYIRNRLLEDVKTPYVVFLDADDYLEPEFAEECLRAIEPGHYVYTNWLQGTEEKETPDGAFWDIAWHLVTCLLDTYMVRLVGGFDETLPVMEDTKLFLQFDKYAYCGIKLKKPLVHYTNEGRRGKEGRANGDVAKVKEMLSRRFRVACCGSANNKPNNTPVGKKMDGDVLVLALWQGNRQVMGQVTNRRYGRAALPRRIWMDERDALVRPDLFRIMNKKPEIVKSKKAIRRRVKKPKTFADMLHAAGMLDLPVDSANVLPVADGIINPDFEKLNEIAQRIYNVQSKPKRSINGNSQTAIVVTGQADTVRAGSTTRGIEAGRGKPVAIGNGQRKREADIVRDSQSIASGNGD
jgi:hypothetical protein